MNYRKIDIYEKTEDVPYGMFYLCSTTWSKTLKAAKARYVENYGLSENAATKIICKFSK